MTWTKFFTFIIFCLIMFVSGAVWNERASGVTDGETMGQTVGRVFDRGFAQIGKQIGEWSDKATDKMQDKVSDWADKTTGADGEEVLAPPAISKPKSGLAPVSSTSR